jgi:hypothetical protein
MAAFVAACRGEQTLSLTLADALEATRIGLAITRSLHSELARGGLNPGLRGSAES